MRHVFAATLLTCGLAATVNAGPIVVVAGTDNPWLAGMPDGSAAVFFDLAPFNSAEQVPLAFSAGQVFTFAVSGQTDHCDAGGCGFAGADGDEFEGVWGKTAGAENGISNLISPIDALVGVFLGPGQPDLTVAPATLDFSTPASRDFDSLSPLLKQAFFIGDGLRNDGTTAQKFFAPAGATRLYLGLMDGFDNWNNAGALEVEVNVPEPAVLALLGVAGLAIAHRRRRRRA